jgi:hypothetical protein
MAQAVAFGLHRGEIDAEVLARARTAGEARTCFSAPLPLAGEGRGRGLKRWRRELGEDSPDSLPCGEGRAGWVRPPPRPRDSLPRADPLGSSETLAVAVGLDHHQRRADRHLIADFAGELDHHARHRRFHLDGRLVGHHVGDLLVLLDALADLDVPRDDLGLGDAFADIRQAESEAGHADQSFRSFLSASPMRTGPGK